MAEWFINTGPFLFNYRFWRNSNLFIYVYFIRGKEILFLPRKKEKIASIRFQSAEKFATISLRCWKGTAPERMPGSAPGHA